MNMAEWLLVIAALAASVIFITYWHERHLFNRRKKRLASRPVMNENEWRAEYFHNASSEILRYISELLSNEIGVGVTQLRPEDQFGIEYALEYSKWPVPIGDSSLEKIYYCIIEQYGVEVSPNDTLTSIITACDERAKGE